MSLTEYVYLPSDTEEGNKSSSFRVVLPQPLRLDGKWFCGLHSIVYPRSFATIGTTEDQAIYLLVHDPKWKKWPYSLVRIKFPRATYKTIQELEAAVNAAVTARANEEREKEQRRTKRSALDDEEELVRVKRATLDPDSEKTEQRKRGQTQQHRVDHLRQMYTRRPTPEEISQRQLREETHLESDGTQVTEFYDSHNELKWRESVLPEFQIVYRTRTLDNKELVLSIQSNTGGLFAGIEGEAREALVQLDGRRVDPNGHRWTSIKLFQRPIFNDYATAYINANGDFLVETPNQAYVYRYKGTTGPEIAVPPKFEYRPPHITDQFQLVHSQSNADGVIVQVLLGRDGDVYIQAGNDPPNKVKIKTLGGARQHPSTRWNFLKTIRRPTTGKLVDVFTNDNSDFYFLTDRGSYIYRNEGLPKTTRVPTPPVELVAPAGTKAPPIAEASPSPTSHPASPTRPPPIETTTVAPVEEPAPKKDETKTPQKARQKAVQRKEEESATSSPAPPPPSSPPIESPPVEKPTVQVRVQPTPQKQTLKEEEQDRIYDEKGWRIFARYGPGIGDERQYDELAKHPGIHFHPRKLSEKLASFKLVYDSLRNRFRIEISDQFAIAHCYFTPQLSYALGYDKEYDHTDGAMASYPPDLTAGVNVLYVYAENLIDAVIVGNKMAPLLRIVTISGEPDTMVETNFDNPVMCHVLPKEIGYIDISIRTADGRLIPFEWGTVTLILIFKKSLYL